MRSREGGESTGKGVVPQPGTRGGKTEFLGNKFKQEKKKKKQNVGEERGTRCITAFKLWESHCVRSQKEPTGTQSRFSTIRRAKNDRSEEGKTFGGGGGSEGEKPRPEPKGD